MQLSKATVCGCLAGHSTSVLALCRLCQSCLPVDWGCVPRSQACDPACGGGRWLGTPKLVRETSRRHWWQRGGPEKSVEDVKRDFSDIVLPPALQARCAPFRNMLCRGLRERRPSAGDSLSHQPP